jgi:putative transposase
MPRKERVEYGGAVYHVMDRGDRLEAIFLDDGDRELFLKTLGQACGRTGWRIHSYVLMGNHYHLLVETPEANLCAGMKWMQSTYTIRFNVRHKQRGHLFQGRYKAVLVDGEDGTYFRTASDYIHLNPVRAGLLAEEESLIKYRWSSFPALVKGTRPEWVTGEWVLGSIGERDNARGRRAYRETLEKRAEEERAGVTMEEGMLKALRRGWCFGAEEFRQRILEMSSLGEKWTHGQIRNSHDEREARRLMRVGLREFGLGVGELESLPKGDVRKIAIASTIKRQTIMGNEWIARELAMGVASRVSRYCSEGEKRPEIMKLVRRVEKSKCKDRPQ